MRVSRFPATPERPFERGKGKAGALDLVDVQAGEFSFCCPCYDSPARDGASVIEEVDQNANLLARYTQGAGIDEPLAELRSGTTSFYEQDGLGSVTSLSSTGGALANTYVYDSYGSLISSTGTVANPYQYTGRDYDPETGLRYYRARYYDASTGRFLSGDPVGFADGTDFYKYTNNHPTDFLDPTGLLAELYCDKIDLSRGGSFNSIFLLLANPTHCYLYVECRGKGVYVELYGPPKNPDGTYGKYGIPHNDTPYSSERAKNSTKHPLHPPAGMRCCEFEDRLMQAFQHQIGILPPYNAFGPNSNTFIYNIVVEAGGTADFPVNAFGVPGAYTAFDLLPQP